MTGQQWLTCKEPSAMRRFLNQPDTSRKSRLVAIACCRRIRNGWPGDAEMQRAIEVGEAVADGVEVDRDSAFRAVLIAMGVDLAAESSITQNYMIPNYQASPLLAAAALLVPYGAYLWNGSTGRLLACDTYYLNRVFRHCKWTARKAAQLVPPPPSSPVDRFFKRFKRSYHRDGWRLELRQNTHNTEPGNLELAAQAYIIRDLFDNPFHPIEMHPNWLTSTTIGLAQAIYEARSYDRMPILADALQDADCDNEPILTHCRSPEEHYRGCWVLDAILGKR